MLKIPEVSALAEAHLLEAAVWYQEQEPQTPLWIELLEEFEATVRLACEHPDAAPTYEGRVRRVLLRRFSYGVYYIVEGDRLAVVNFLAMRQEQRRK